MSTEDEIEDAWASAQSRENDHRISWHLGDEHVWAEVVCQGRSDAYCRAYCPHGCEVSPCAHMPKFGKSCGVNEWWDDGLQHYYNGPETSVRDGLIVPVWDGDTYLWHYADEPPVTPQDGQQP